MRWRLFEHVVRGRRVISELLAVIELTQKLALFSLLDTPQSYQRLASRMAGAGDGSPARVRARLSTLTLVHILCPV